MSSLLDQARLEFPRLYFLADNELVSMLAVSRSPQALVQYVQKCFSGIESLKYALPSHMSTSALNSDLDFKLNGKFVLLLHIL